MPALVETFGGVAPELLGMLRQAAGFRMNRLTKAEYAETTWSARNWLTFVSQRFAVAVQRSMAEEIGKALIENRNMVDKMKNFKPAFTKCLLKSDTTKKVVLESIKEAAKHAAEKQKQYFYYLVTSKGR